MNNQLNDLLEQKIEEILGRKLNEIFGLSSPKGNSKNTFANSPTRSPMASGAVIKKAKFKGRGRVTNPNDKRLKVNKIKAGKKVKSRKSVKTAH